ncbi:MAG TPA: Rne/Rng family ribonuclease [Tepidisphaeraceae bacterium]|jgi:ribonuclease E|nr:Rne/Rng family ribonuclease [Tepidisphaeraceae bacterium]
MSKEMLINVSEGEECRIALVEDGRLEELYMERNSATSHVGNIYKGRVTNVEPSIQAAFVDFGMGRNGFLHISDLMPTYFGRDGSDYQETVGRKMARRDRPPIQRCLRRGDEIIVQIIKEGIGTKGPTLTSYISIPGRILVMMPGMGKMGVSKKIEDDAERRRLRTILDGLKPPKDVAFIIRTAGIGKAKTEIERDLKYLTRLWETIEKKQKEPGPVELYTEGDLVTRTVRDVFTSDVERIVVDNKDVARRVKDVIKITAPRTKNKVDVYEDGVPLFHQYGIERDIEMMYSRHVPLPSGGSLVIDSTEAIVAIDVNSGKNRESGDAETTAFRVDMEAADEICRQLKLRDLGGVIICDFIDLRYDRHRRELEKRLDDNFKRDRAKTKVLRMSQFGIIEMTRQRMRPSLKRSVYFDCPHCKGAGLVKTPESMALDVMRKLAIAAHDQRVVRVELACCPDVAFSLLNKKRRQLAELEDETQKKVLIRSDASLGLDELKLSLFDARDGAVILEELGMTLPQMGHVTQLGTRGGGGGRGGRGGGRNDRRDGGGRNQQQQSRPAARAMEDEEDEDERFARETAEEAQESDSEEEPSSPPQRAAQGRRDDRGGRSRNNAEREVAPQDVQDDQDDQDDESAEGEESAAEGSGQQGDDAQQSSEGGRRRRRRRRGRRGRSNGDAPREQQSEDRADSPNASYNQGRRADGSFENVTEMETVDFGDEDEDEGAQEAAPAASNFDDTHEDENDPPQPLTNESRPIDRGNGRRRGRGGRDRGGREGGNRAGGGGGDNRRNQQPPTRIPPKPQQVAKPVVASDDEEEGEEVNGNLAPAAAGAEGETGEQPQKRRRRRGGRRHRRRRENQMARENTAVGLLPPSPNDSGEAIASADDDDQYVDAELDDAEGDEEVEAVDVADTEEAEAPPAPEPVAKVPARDQRSSTSRSNRVRRPSPPPAPLPVVKTGSTDKHLVAEEVDADEEVAPEVDAIEDTAEAEAPAPARRVRTSRRAPSSYSDLDAIPDDYD